MLSKNNFPIFKNNPGLVYLDGGATTQKPTEILDVERRWYEKYNANVHRGLYNLSVIATNEYEKARQQIAGYFSVNPKKTIFVRNTTEGLNLIAQSYKKYLKKGDSIVISALEHHSNILPWREIAKNNGVELKVIDIKGGRIDIASAKKLIDERTKIVSIAHVSNVFGTIQPIKEVADIAHGVGAIVVVDGAQAVAHSHVSPWEIGADAYVFSGHKVYGPNGIGVAFIREKLGQKLDHFLLGGEMVESVLDDSFRPKPGPWRFEAGTPNTAGAVALAKALELFYTDFDSHKKKLDRLKNELFKVLSDFGAEIYSPKDVDIPLISFNLPGRKADEVAIALNKHNIAVRSGHLCAQPLTSKLNENGVVRVSAGLWNEPKDTEKFKAGLSSMS